MPGDIVSLPANQSLLSFDAVLISGSCIVNEGMLTGESVPVIKCPLTCESTPGEVFSIDLHKKHVLFSGTQIVPSRGFGNERIRAVVIRTGQIVFLIEDIADKTWGIFPFQGSRRAKVNWFDPFCTPGRWVLSSTETRSNLFLCWAPSLPLEPSTLSSFYTILGWNIHELYALSKW